MAKNQDFKKSKTTNSSNATNSNNTQNKKTNDMKDCSNSTKSSNKSNYPSAQDQSVIMAKAGMRRPDPKEPHGTESNHKSHFPKNDVKPVPEIQGKAKKGHDKANPM